MQTSEAGIEFIKANEGFRGTVYNDNGKQAIGYGHDLQPGESFPNGISPDEADLLLRKDLASRFESVINKLIPLTCTQNQYDALADFAYNLGTGALRTMLGHGWDQVPQQLPRWCHIGLEVSSNLVDRRNKELALWLTR